MCALVCRILEGERDLKLKPFGGFAEAERKRIAFFPDYFSEDEIIFPICAVKITHNAKFTSGLSHRDFLGSILGLGLERSRVGDIVVLDDAAYCFAEDDIASYIAANLEKVGRASVKTEIINPSEIVMPEKKMDIKNVTVSSLRADTVFGAVFGKSRSEAQELIRSERASVNWNVINSVSETIDEGDILSLKGSGRGKLVEVGGTTKKGRIVITVGRYV
ncbi:MAG: YlmH/Sll1252 family protein [Clostridiales bacterium]|nr:YlmH/Sll1252 family protein [Clostridiales bacterium]